MSKLPSKYDIIIERMTDMIDEGRDEENILELARDRLMAKYDRTHAKNKRYRGKEEG